MPVTKLYMRMSTAFSDAVFATINSFSVFLPITFTVSMIHMETEILIESMISMENTLYVRGD